MLPFAVDTCRVNLAVLLGVVSVATLLTHLRRPAFVSVMSKPLAIEASQWVWNVRFYWHTQITDLDFGREIWHAKSQDVCVRILLFASMCHRDSFNLCNLLACQFLLYLRQAHCIQLPAPSSLHHITPFFEFSEQCGETLIGTVASSLDLRRLSACDLRVTSMRYAPERNLLRDFGSPAIPLIPLETAKGDNLTSSPSWTGSMIKYLGHVPLSYSLSLLFSESESLGFVFFLRWGYFCCFSRIHS